MSATNPNAFATNFLPLTGGTVTGTITLTGGTISYGTSAHDNTSPMAGSNILTPANTNGTAAQLSDTARDYMLYLTVGTAGTAMTVLIGPTASPANTIYNAATATAGEAFGFRLPAGWFWEWAATTATLASQLAIAC